MARLPAASWPLFLVAAALVAGAFAAQTLVDDNVKCDKTPLQAVFLFDLSPDNRTDFTKQQQRVVETIRHMDVLTHERSISFGFVVFHRIPVLLSPLNSPKSGDSSKVTEQVQSVRPRRHADTSPAKALDLAAEQIEKNGRAGARSLVFLVHDGLNNDLIAETLEAVERLRDQSVHLFVISGAAKPNLLALSGYTRQRERIYAHDSDRLDFLAALDRVIGLCEDTERRLIGKVAESIDTAPVLTTHEPNNTDAEVEERGHALVFNATQIRCAPELKVDLMVVLDTSGSVFNVFAQERALAQSVVEALEPEAFANRMQVGLVSFASEPLVLLSLFHGRSVDAVAHRIATIEFTGKNTRIADAVELALQEFETRRRPDALPVFLLITDGHGQEYWSQAQVAGRKLQQSGAQIFVATTSADYNLPEMLLYAGAESRVFVGPRTPAFLPTVSAFINRCVGHSDFHAAVVADRNVSSKSVKNNQESSKNATGFDNTVVIKLADTATAAANASKHSTPSAAATLVLSSVSKESAESSSENGTLVDSAETDLQSAKERADQMRTFLEQQKGLHRSTDCDTDIVFLVDRTQRSSFDFGQQLELAARTVDNLMPSDVTSGKVRLGLVTFSKKARVPVPLGTSETTTSFLSKLRAVQPGHSTARLERGLTALLQEVREHRRNDTRLVVVLVTSGRTPADAASAFGDVLKQFQALRKTDVFALSLHPSSDLGVLKRLTGDRWRVFVDARVRQFVRAVGVTVSSCALAADAHAHSDAETEPRNSVEKVERLAVAAQNLEKSCNSDPVDLVLVLDQAPTSTAHFDRQKQVAMDLVKQASAIDYESRVRVAVVAFNEYGRTVVSLNDSVSREDLLFTLDRLERTGGPTSAVAGLSQSLADVQSFRRIGARLVVVLVSNGNSRDGWARIQKAGNALRRSNAEVFAVALGPEKNLAELEVYTGTRKHVFSDTKAPLFVLSAQKVVFGCSLSLRERHLADIAVAGQESEEPEHVELLDKAATVKVSPTTTTTAPAPASPTPTPETEQHIKTLFSDDCTVDLMFIIDTSQSVANEFQQQLQFAVDLVKRLPDDDFEQRVSVAAVSFFRSARVEFPFGQLRAKNQVLDALFAVHHTGGSTSAVSGVDLAVEEIVRGRRPGARLMVVLVSDGNSQDPWQNVLDAAAKLRSVNADVYAVTVSHDYFFRELELYAGNKWFVYIDARIRQFLDEAEMSIVECRNPTIPAAERPLPTTTIGPPTKLQDVASTLAALSTTPAPSSTSTVAQFASKDCQDQVDLLIVLDTSTSVEKEFYAEKNFALDLVKVLPEADFSQRIRIALIKFHSKALLQFGFGDKSTRNDVLYEIERVEHTGGQTSLVAGVSLALEQVANGRRVGSRLVTLIVSDGNSQDEWATVQATAKRLRNTGSEIYAVTLSDRYYMDELKEYTGNERHVYTDERIDQFIQDVGQSVVSCPGHVIARVTPAPNVEVSVTPTSATETPEVTTQHTTEPFPKPQVDLAVEAMEPQFALARDTEPEVMPGDAALGMPKCKYSKMDLIIILDASSSRESVFEHQRELALSLIERLPISKDDTHVATGLNSFTNIPTLRQTLGLGRDKLMVRHAIEDIKYHGGSTLTSKAVELAVKDLERGRRPDALQVVVLMNDGMSQDPWDEVLRAAADLKATKAERFGVALGKEVDLRELRHYIENETRIYRDGSTERFLTDVTALLGGGEKECSVDTDDDGFEPTPSIEDCTKPKLDVVVVFDASDDSPNQDDPKISANKYLLLDVLGSLPANDDVKVSITSFGPEPKLEHRFSDPQDRDSLFERIEGIQTVRGVPSYAKSVQSAVSYYNSHKRPDARGLLLIVGDGVSSDKSEDRSLVANAVRKTKGIQCHAVDSGKMVDERTLAAYTGDVKRVYNYDRNADFAKELLRLATFGQTEQCVETRKQIQVTAATEANQDETTYATPSTDEFRQRQKDIAAQVPDGDKELISEKVIAAIPRKSTLRPIPTSTTEIPSTTKTTTTAAPTATAETSTTTTSVKPSSSSTTTTAVPKTTKTTTVQVSTAKAATKGSISSRTTLTTTTTATTTKKPASTTRSTTLRPTKARHNSTPPAALAPAVLRADSTTPSTTPRPLRTTLPPEPSTPFVPGCLFDIIFIMDSSGSVEATFNREKELAANILQKLRIGPENARVALLKFAATEKVRTILPFDGPQTKNHVLRALQNIPFSSGTTAIHSALLHAVTEYSPLKGARPGRAEPLAIIFTDGFGQRDTSKESAVLRQAIPELYAVAINHQYPISRVELERITGDPRRVFTDANIDALHRLLAQKFRSC